MRRIVAGLSILMLCGFECGPNGPWHAITPFTNGLVFTFSGVDDDETPNCFEAQEEVDLSDYQDMLNQAGELANLEIISVVMTLQNITDANTARQISGSCSLQLGDATDMVDLGSYSFEVTDGATISQDYDTARVNAWLTEKIRQHGKVTFNLVACMEQDAFAGFDAKVELKGQVIAGNR